MSLFLEYTYPNLTAKITILPVYYCIPYVLFFFFKTFPPPTPGTLGRCPKEPSAPHVHRAAAKASAPCARASHAHWYWFTRLYCSPNPRSSLNIIRR